MEGRRRREIVGFTMEARAGMKGACREDFYFYFIYFIFLFFFGYNVGVVIT
jgi:hypothetical protein